MLMSSSPGILDGDAYELLIEVGNDSSVEVLTQSYQRLFQSTKGARQSMQVRLGENSSLIYLPHPVVPHKASVFKQHNVIRMADNCELLWGEIISCGRKLNEEVFQFSSYHCTTAIYLNERLIVKENLLLEPEQIDLGSIGQLEGYTHQSTLLYINASAKTSDIAPVVLDYLSLQEGIAFGVSALPVNGIVVRLLGQKAEQLFDIHKAIANCIVKHTSDKEVTYV
jgi:urease accessory protein